MALVSAYNAGNLEAVMALLDENVGWSDCDYRTVRAVEASGKTQVSEFLRQRLADHDHFEIASISNHNPDPDTMAIGLEFARRTSDTLRSLGFSQGIKPQSAAKVAFARPDGPIKTFANGPVGGSAELCRPTTS